MDVPEQQSKRNIKMSGEKKKDKKERQITEINIQNIIDIKIEAQPRETSQTQKQ